MVAFYIETKDDDCIMFCVYNLLTRAESPVQFATGKLGSPDFLTSNSRYIINLYKEFAPKLGVNYF
ncbi:hypothetical protein LIBAT_10590 [Leptospira interrogans]